MILLLQTGAAQGRAHALAAAAGGTVDTLELDGLGEIFHLNASETRFLHQEIFAGDAFHHKKPTHAPNPAAASTARSSGSRTS